jgi:hypothetical protein
MNASPRAAITRISILLLVICAVAFGWERAKNAGLRRTTGQVVAVHQVLAGTGGDSKEFTIHYQWQKKDYQLVTRRGILDSLGSLRRLQRGDNVPLAVSPESPRQAVVDTITARYGVTLCLATLTAVFFLVALSIAAKNINVQSSAK